MPRVEIWSASYGGGHDAVAKALAEAVAGALPGADVEVVDFMAVALPELKRLTERIYVLWTRYLPATYTWFYERTRPGQADEPGSLLRRGLRRVGAGRVARRLRATRPGLVFATHAVAAGVVSRVSARLRPPIPVVAAVTDHTVHAEWLHPDVALYLAPDDDTARGLVARGLAPLKVAATGMPVRQAFHEARAAAGRGELRRRLGLDAERPALLFMAGADATAPGLLSFARELAREADEAGWQAVFVAGRDERFRARLARAVAEAGGARARVLGYVERIWDWMGAVDLVVTKPGGVTTSEAVALGTPLVVYGRPVGQERDNVAFLLRHGLARHALRARDVGWILRRSAGSADEEAKGAPEGVAAGLTASHAAGHAAGWAAGLTASHAGGLTAGPAAGGVEG
ncbi:MAG: hypothetical protein IRZ11_08425, partial [Clostridia bacterium]|nr:hypothetical protein [Clostridia bacterium]